MMLVSLQLGAAMAGADAAAVSRADRIRSMLWGWRFRSPTTCSTSAADRGDGQARGQRLGPRQADVSRLARIEESSRRAEALVAAGHARRLAPLEPQRRAGLQALGPTTCSKGITNMMDKLLSKIESPRDLQQSRHRRARSSWPARCATCCATWSPAARPTSPRTWAWSSCAWRCTPTFDFSRDRLIWDTGHQIYPHKLITGRYHEFGTMRTQGRPDGLPQPARKRLRPVHDRPRRLQRLDGAGPARAATTCCGEDDRHRVAVIGDGAFPSGIVFEAMNNAGGLKTEAAGDPERQQDVDLPARRRLGRVSRPAARQPVLHGLKSEVLKVLNKVPLLGDPVERFLAQLKESIKAGLHGGMLFEELGFRYIGPIDGHNIGQLRKYLAMVKDVDGPGAAARGHRKGARLPAGRRRSGVLPHAGAVHARGRADPGVQEELVEGLHQRRQRGDLRADGQRTRKVTVLTAAMCQGNKLETVREEFPDRFFDTGICESHAVAFAAGQAKAGLRPIVDIYSTFLQRSYDQIFQEVALQNLPVTFMLDRAGLTGPDGPTHHGVFDIGYMRLFPNMVVMAPGDAARRCRRCSTSPSSTTGPTSIRYPKAKAETIDGTRAADRAGPGRSDRLGARRHDHRLRHAADRVRQGGRHAARRRARRRRDQRPLRQAARYRDDPPRHRQLPVRGHRRRRRR